MSFRTPHTWARLATAATLGATALTGCSYSPSAMSADGVPLVKKDKLTVCVHTPRPPFHTKDPSGQIVGFDIDLLALVAKRLGVDVSPIERRLAGIESGDDLDDGECDVAAGLIANDELRESMEFSTPYFDNAQVIAIRQSDTHMIKDAGALRGKKISVQKATSAAGYAHEVEKEKGFTVVEYSDFELQQRALTDKEVDGSVADLPTWAEFNRQNPNQIAIVEQLDTSEKYAYATREDAEDKLLQAINDALWEAHNSGEYNTIYAKWFGSR